MRKTLTSVGALVAILVGFGLFAPSANAAVYSEMLRSWKTGGCLDSDGAGKVYMRGCHEDRGNAYQIWNFTPNGAPWFLIQNKATKRCLHATGSGNGAPLYTGSCATGDATALWQQVANGSSPPDYQARYKPAQWQWVCLDGYGLSAYTHTCNNDGYQIWRRGF